MPKRPRSLRPRSPVAKLIPERKERERKKFYDSKAWRDCRASFLESKAICEDCLKQGKYAEATIAHHDRERLDRPDLAFDHDNLIALCSPCHTTRHKAKASDDGTIHKAPPY
jgi:5-methylcytosine-specific restriction protein A